MVLFTFWYLKEQMATWRTSWNFIGTYDFEIMFLETTNKYPSNEQVRYPFPLRHEQKSIVELPEIELTVSAWLKGTKMSTADGGWKLGRQMFSNRNWVILKNDDFDSVK